MVEGVGGVVDVGCAGAGEGDIDGVGDGWGGGVVDRPEGGDDVAVAQELHGGGEVDGFVKCPGAAGSGLAGGQERQLSWSGVVLLGQVSDAQWTVGVLTATLCEEDRVSVG